ncbi:MAG: metal-binding protein [Cyclobacteriaceae bacterium]|nr:metal-binding protein [Cyclobacteriaceae bacterium]
MIRHADIGRDELRVLIECGAITLAGNGRLKIYGLLTCTSGKRMKPENRVFFKSEKEALQAGFRPCGHCMRRAYTQWRDTSGFPDTRSL